MAAKRFQTRTEEEIDQLLHDKSTKSTNKATLSVLGVSGKQDSFPWSLSACCLPNDDLWFGLSSFRN